MRAGSFLSSSTPASINRFAGFEDGDVAGSSASRSTFTGSGFGLVIKALIDCRRASHRG
jgi:hypothetical protein